MERLRPGYSQFYVYEHWRPDTEVCFYVGKGSKLRAYEFVYNRNRSYLKIVKELKKKGLALQVYFWKLNLLEGDALAVEIERIAYWRAAGVDLVNRTNGGDGVSGYRPTAEAIAKQRAALKLLYIQQPLLRNKCGSHAKGKSYAKGHKYVPTAENLKNLSVAMKGKRSKNCFELTTSVDLRTEIIVAYINGATMEAICGEHHCSNGPIKKWLAEAGVPLRGRGGHGRSPTSKTRAKISFALTGRKRESPGVETRDLISASLSAALAIKKAAGIPRHQPGSLSKGAPPCL